jgi:N-acetylglucosaminyldiphosphoundecaprenol N-acetyl-beta-D-mannosaminyltransferase
MEKQQGDFVEVMGFRVFSDSLERIPVHQGSARVINTISPNSYGLATRQRSLSQALRSSDYLVLDGVYFALAAILLKGRNIRRNQGPDVFFHFMQRMQHQGGRVFFLGSGPETLRLIRQRAAREYPNITVGTYSPPFCDQFTEADNRKMTEAVNAFGPDILFVGMTCPKQEIWSIQNRDALNTGLVISVGNVFDWFAGTQKAIHPIWFRLRLGWLIRIFLRPEIFRRNIGNQMKFFHDTLLVFLGFKQGDPTLN